MNPKKTKKPLITSLIAIARSLKSEIIGNKFPPLYYKMLAIKSSKGPLFSASITIDRMSN